MKKDNIFVRIKNSIYNVEKIYEYSTYGLNKAILYSLVFGLLIGIVSLAGFNKSNITSVNDFCNGMSKIIIDNNVEINKGNIDTSGNKIKKEIGDYYIYINEDKTLDDSSNLKIDNDSIYTLLFLKDGIKVQVDDTLINTEWKYSDFLGNNNTSLNSTTFSALFASGKIISIIFLSVFCIISTFINYFIFAFVAAICAMSCNLIFGVLIRFSQMFSLAIYAGTLPTIMISIFNLFKPNVDFQIGAFLGTVIYTILVIREISKKKINTNV